MKKIIALFLTVFAIGSFAFADAAAENYLSHFESLVTRIEADAKAQNISAISSYEAQKQTIDAERATVTLSLFQRFTDWRYTGRFDSALSKLKAYEAKDNASKKTSEKTDNAKQKAEDALEHAKESANEAAKDAKKTANEKLDSAKNKLNEKLDSLEKTTKEKVGGTVESTTKKAEEKIKTGTSKAAETVKTGATKANETIKAGVSKTADVINDVLGEEEKN